MFNTLLFFYLSSVTLKSVTQFLCHTMVTIELYKRRELDSPKTTIKPKTLRSLNNRTSSNDEAETKDKTPR